MKKTFIRINLNQMVSRFQLEEMVLDKQQWNITYAMIALFVVSILFLNYNNIKFNNIIDERNQNIEDLEANIRKLQKDISINLSKEDIESLFKFESKRQYWTPKLESLAALTPLNMVLTEIEFVKNRLRITAMTKLEEGVKEFDVIEEFMNLFQEDENFKTNFNNIKFVSSSREKTNKSATLSFKIEAKLNKN